MFETKPAGFESHWDWQWFKEKSDECRSIANLIEEPKMQNKMHLLAADFQKQSDHAKLLAGIFTNREK